MAFRTALNLNPKTFQAHKKAALAYERQKEGEHETAIPLYLEALEINPDEAGWWYNLGISYQHLGRIQEARKAYQHALNLSPKDENFRAALNLMGGKEK